jgi:hypothetical protein
MNRTLVELHGQRMTIGQVFRDQKNRGYGWALRNIVSPMQALAALRLAHRGGQPNWG